jgi:hypothetical protein
MADLTAVGSVRWFVLVWVIPWHAVSCPECERLDRAEALATKEFIEAEARLQACSLNEWTSRKGRRDNAEQVMKAARDAASSHRHTHSV